METLRSQDSCLPIVPSWNLCVHCWRLPELQMQCVEEESSPSSICGSSKQRNWLHPNQGHHVSHGREKQDNTWHLSASSARNSETSRNAETVRNCKNTAQPSWTGSFRWTGWALLSWHRFGQFCAPITSAKSFKEELVEKHQGICVHRGAKRSLEVTWRPPPWQRRGCSASQHHTRDDSDVKLALKEPHKKKNNSKFLFSSNKSFLAVRITGEFSYFFRYAKRNCPA